MKLKDINSVYLIGIGGIGMSALARWFKANGYYVAGYDKTESELTQALVAENISVHYDDDPDLIPAQVTKSKVDTLIIYTPAIPEDHKELNFLQGAGFTVKKRSEVLGMITADFKSIAIAGTHGKTTTTSMVAHILKHSGFKCSAFVGGITKNYNSNLLLDETTKKDTVVVMEADEYDRSFLRLNPDVSLITTIDADHLDIYKDEKDFEDTFREFVKCIKEGGSLIYNTNIESDFKKVRSGLNYYTYGLNKGENYGHNLRIQNGEYIFDYDGMDEVITGIRLQLPGHHNVENAVGAISTALLMGVPADKVKAAIEDYKGVKRRFDYIVKEDKMVYIDDYAHHPQELEAFITSAKAMFPGRKLKVIFQPHLFSRTRDFMEEFARVLSKVNALVLLDIYPAREKPIEGITAEALLKKIDIKDKVLIAKDQVVDHVMNSSWDVLATCGAGDIDRLVKPIKKALEEKVYA